MAGSSGGLCEELFDENGDADNTGLFSSGVVRVGISVHVFAIEMDDIRDNRRFAESVNLFAFKFLITT